MDGCGWRGRARRAAELTLSHGEWLDSEGDLTTAHLDVDLPVVPGPLPLGQIDEVVSGGDGDVFEPRFTTHGFRYVRVEGHPGPLEPDDVTAVVVHSDLRRLGWFACSDERVNRLHEAVVWSLRDNMCDIPTDCPQRERAGWTGDWQVFAPTAAYLYDVLAFTRKWLADVSLDQRADGCVPNLSPCRPPRASTGRSARSTARPGGATSSCCPLDLPQAYGDISLLRETWGSMTAWVQFAAAAAAGGRHPARAAARPEAAAHERYLWDTGFHWGEWMEPGAVVTDFPAFVRADKSETATAYLCRSAATVARVAAALGWPEDQWHRYHVIAEGALDAWRREFVRPDGTLAVQTQASHVRALAFGLVPEELRPAVAGRLVELIGLAGGHLATGFLSTVHLLPVLADSGHLGPAYQLLLQDTSPSWLTMVGRGATTMWEEWDGVDEHGVPHGSPTTQQGGGGHLPAQLRRGPAADRARIPDLRGAPATGRRHHLRHDAPRQPVRGHRGVLAPGREIDEAGRARAARNHGHRGPARRGAARRGAARRGARAVPLDGTTGQHR